jgi:hypothetical protein
MAKTMTKTGTGLKRRARNGPKRVETVILSPKITYLKRRRGPVVENQGRALKSGMLGETA